MPPRRRGALAGGDPALLRFLRSIEKLTGENSRASRRRDERAIEVLQCELYREAGSSSASSAPAAISGLRNSPLLRRKPRCQSAKVGENGSEAALSDA